MIHLRNGQAEKRAHVRGTGEAWCGKKLIGQPDVERDGIETFTVYGNVLEVSPDPEQVTCPHCRDAFDAAYAAAFPEGPKPLATFRLDDPADMERAKAALSPAALSKFFGPGGGGMDALEAALREPAQ